ncbi:tryptophan tryptophylquinone biosynthesis enzyme MauG [Endozoicomonas sp. SM1973]|uniref:Methylamine utilization protein MauG n=1 Tax=Spartinivicinus marinus TaxID=2994442 RepID=A0A853I5D1_9GAMM|nr:tryptophan tryptophylquinone biosynthesis enzyme MauG [Spartinivicinus marinus]
MYLKDLFLRPFLLALLLLPELIAVLYASDDTGSTICFEPGHPSLQHWLLPALSMTTTATAVEQLQLGKLLFFDPRLSANGNFACSTCHNPSLGWSDGLKTAIGQQGVSLNRATPSLINVAYNKVFMWDGRQSSLESQVLGVMGAEHEMNADYEKLLIFLNQNPKYRELFAKAFPDKHINKEILAAAIAQFERTIISKGTPFDRWITGDSTAMSTDQIAGFQIFISKTKGNCASCHHPPNFTDDGFHNIGLQSFASPNPDLGRYNVKPIKISKGAFKTPPLRGIRLTAPYFHDGSAATLDNVIEHYAQGGKVRTNIDPEMKKLSLSKIEKKQLKLFLEALTTTAASYPVPILP